MSKRYGKARAPGCECTRRFTCAACLKGAPSYFYTPNMLAACIAKGGKVTAEDFDAIPFDRP